MLTTTRGSSQAASLLRRVFLFLLIALMLLLVFLTVRVLFFIPSSPADLNAGIMPETQSGDDPAGPEVSSLDQAAAAGSGAVVPLNGDTTSDGSVACGRPVGASQLDPFKIQVDDRSPSSEDLTVGVDLLNEGGERSSRQVSLPATGEVGVRQTEVPDSADSAYRSCIITAIQRGDRVILTGR